MERVIGQKKLERKLNSLASRGSNKVARAAMVGAVAPLKKAIRRGVNGTTASTGLKRAARASVGSSVKKQPDGSYGAKAGLGVGKPTKKKRENARARAGSKRRGVGISARNIHWAVLGTKDRTQKKTGRFTGKMEASLEGVIPAAVAGSRGAMLREAAKRSRVALKKEAKKGR